MRNYSPNTAPPRPRRSDNNFSTVVEALRDTSTQYGPPSLVSFVFISLVHIVISVSIELLFGQIRISDDAPLFAWLLWIQQNSTLVLLVGIVSSLVLLLLLQKQIPQVRTFIHWFTHWFTETRMRLYGSIGVTALVVIIAIIHPWIPDIFVYTTHSPGTLCATHADAWRLRTDATAQTCTNDGTDMTVTDGSTLGEVSLDPRKLHDVGNMPTYCVQVTVAFQQGGDYAAAVIGVHGQNPGGQVVELFQGGDLRIVRYSHETGTVDGEPLFKGSFQATSPYHLAVGVDGSYISVWVNKTLVASISDSKYTTTQYVLVGLQSDGFDSAEATLSEFALRTGTLAGCGSEYIYETS